MDYIFWIGLILGAVLSLAASIAANLANSKIGNFIEKGRHSIKLRKKKKDLENFKMIESLHADLRKFLSQILFNLSIFIVSTSLGGIFIGIALIFAVNERIKTPEIPLKDKDLFVQMPFWFGVFLSFWLFYIGLLNFMNAAKCISRTNSFQSYKDQIVSAYAIDNAE